MRKLFVMISMMFFGIAVAQEMPAFEDVDANGDGAISAEEAAAVEGLDFAAKDTDQSGSLSREEYEAA
ncbi:MAG TPA: hypothetical protein VGC50_13940 [Gammaproteobacteria bacterium]|jgi:hypothetical protein